MNTLSHSQGLCDCAVARVFARLQRLVAVVVMGLFAATMGAQAASATPKVERIARGAPNAPYVLRGIKYKPLNRDVPFKQRGIASWYGGKFHGRLTANGEVFDKHAMTAAHPTLPLPSYVRVRHIRSGRDVIVRVNDRGPYHGGRIIDLSRAAAMALGVQSSGTAEVEIERLTFSDIRTGRWKSHDQSPQEESEGAAFVAASPSNSEQVDADKQASDEYVAMAATEEPHWLELGAYTDASQAEQARLDVIKTWPDVEQMKTTLVQQGASMQLLLGPFKDAINAAIAAREVRSKLQINPRILQ